MPDFTKLWDKTYIFGPNPQDLTRSDYIFFWGAAAAVVASIVLKVFVLRKSRDNPLRFGLNRLFHLFLTMGILVSLWAGLRYENIPWLSAHFVVLLLAIIGLIWAGYIVKYFLREFPYQKKVWEEQKVKEKYLRRS